jgi:O-antigen ligase
MIPAWAQISDLLSGLMARMELVLRIADFARGTTISAEDTSSVAERFRLIKEQYNAFTESPILGIGFGNAYIYVHNVLLEALFETGIIGLLLLMAIVHEGSKRSFRILQQKQGLNTQEIALPIISLLWLYFAIAGLFSSTFENLYLWLWTGAILNLPVGRKLKLTLSELPSLSISGEGI